MEYSWIRASNGTYSVRNRLGNRIAVCYCEADAIEVTNGLNGTNTLSLGKLREANIKRAAEWETQQPATLSFMGNELAGEVGEACNVIKKLERHALGWPGAKGSIDHLLDELGDSIVCIDRIANLFGADTAVIAAKKFNKTSVKYGFKTMIELP